MADGALDRCWAVLTEAEKAAIDASVLAGVLRRTDFDVYGVAPISAEFAERIADCLDTLASECGVNL